MYLFLLVINPLPLLEDSGDEMDSVTMARLEVACSSMVTMATHVCGCHYLEEG